MWGLLWEKTLDDMLGQRLANCLDQTQIIINGMTSDASHHVAFNNAENLDLWLDFPNTVTEYLQLFTVGRMLGSKVGFSVGISKKKNQIYTNNFIYY